LIGQACFTCTTRDSAWADKDASGILQEESERGERRGDGFGFSGFYSLFSFFCFYLKIGQTRQTEETEQTR